MPKQTFLDLNKNKQNKLIDASIKEFSRVPLHEALISNIIKDAGIPRGSFYQYFKDKEDLYFFLLNEHAKKYSGKFISIIKEKNGDLFDTFIEYFKFMLQETQTEHQSFYKNIFLNTNSKVESEIFKHIFEKDNRSQCLIVFNLTNKENLNIKNEKELGHIINILMAVMFQNFIQIFLRKISVEEVIENYIFQINLLKNGICNSNH